MSRDSRLLGTAQRALPLVLLTLGIIELGAVLGAVVVGAEPLGPAAVAGPGTFVPVTLAVVFATLLRASCNALPVKGVTAVGAALFALVRIGLVASVVLADDGAAGVAGVLGAVSGVVLGLTLAAWAGVEFHAARAAVRTSGSDREPTAAEEQARQPAVTTAVGVPGPAVHPSPVTARPTAPRPLQVVASLPVSQPTPPSRGASVRSAAAVSWQRGSTPWPRKNEDDPDGTVLRPPRRRGQVNPTRR